MKILISCNNISSYGGGEIYNYELARELSKKHSVTLVTHTDVNWNFPLVKDLLQHSQYSTFSMYNIRIFNFIYTQN